MLPLAIFSLFGFAAAAAICIVVPLVVALTPRRRNGDVRKQADFRPVLIAGGKPPALPARREALPARQEALPAGREALPARREALPAGREASPTRQEEAAAARARPESRSA